MASWKFFDYITQEDRNLIGEWYDSQDTKVQAEFDATLLILTAIDDWEDDEVEEFKPLTNKHRGLGEVRFYVDSLAPGAKRPHRRRFRPVGVWPPSAPREFVLLLGCEKIGRQMVPHDAFGVALKHKTMLENGKGRVREHI